MRVRFGALNIVQDGSSTCVVSTNIPKKYYVHCLLRLVQCAFAVSVFSPFYHGTFKVDPVCFVCYIFSLNNSYIYMVIILDIESP